MLGENKSVSVDCKRKATIENASCCPIMPINEYFKHKSPYIFENSSSLKILHARRVTSSKFHTEDPQILRHHCTKFSCPGDLVPRTCASHFQEICYVHHIFHNSGINLSENSVNMNHSL